MELKIDGQICDPGTGSTAVPGYDAATTESVDAARQGRSLTLSIPFSARNNALLMWADDPRSAFRFNDAVHTAELSERGARLIEGTVRLLAVHDDAYEIEIRSGAAGWAEQASLRKLDDLKVDWSFNLTPTDIYQSWTNDSPVRFLPVHHDSYEQMNSSTDLLVAERFLAVEDYHPFLHIAPLVGQIFAQAGYRVQSRFLESDLFQSLYMSGAFASRDTAAAVNRMGFQARRLGPVTAAANESGRVTADPNTQLNSVGNIVETATPQSIDVDGEAVSGLYNNGNCFSSGNGTICFTPPTEITVGFEYFLKYTTQHRILSRTRLAGFDTVYLGTGSEYRFWLTNRYKDLRDEPLSPNFAYRVIVFDHVPGAQYRMTYTRDGVPDALWSYFAERAPRINTPGAGTFTDPVLWILDGSQWIPYTGDWALYNGYIGETGTTTVDVKLRSPSERITPASPKYFDRIYFGGADEGMELTLHKECSLRPLFRPGPGYGSTVEFADVTRLDIRQSELLEALFHLFNLRCYTEEETRTVWIEPETDFYGAAPEVDWSRRTDFSQPVIREQIVPTIHEERTLRFQEGDGAVTRFDTEEQTTLGAWSFQTPSCASLQGEEVSRNPLFAPTLDSTGHYRNAPSARLPQVGDRDDAEDDGTNFTPRIVRYLGIKPLPADERWGYPSGRNEYPLAAFLYAGDETTEPFTLGFEDRDGAQGLHRYYDRQFRREALGERITLWLHIEPHEFEELFSPGVGGPDIRSPFRIDTGNGVVTALLRRIDEYDPRKASTRCTFERLDPA